VEDGESTLTPEPHADHNSGVARLPARQGITVVAVATIVGGLLLPPLHVHPESDHVGQHHTASVIHQHWAAHHEELGPEFEGPDHHGGHVKFFEQTAVASAFAAGDQNIAIAVPLFLFSASLPGDPTAVRPVLAARPHGPPRASQRLRAPPTTSA